MVRALMNVATLPSSTGYMIYSCVNRVLILVMLCKTLSKEVAIGKTKPPKKSTKNADPTSATQGETSRTRTRGAKVEH